MDKKVLDKLRLSLFGLRAGVFIVFFMWTADKFVNPEHTARVFDKFYMIGGLTEWPIYFIGALQAIFLVCFLFGICKKYSYGAILVMHAVSTCSTYAKLMDPWSGVNLLFFAAVPMLAACLTLFLMREFDTLYTWERCKK